VIALTAAPADPSQPDAIRVDRRVRSEERVRVEGGADGVVLPLVVDWLAVCDLPEGRVPSRRTACQPRAAKRRVGAPA
jgi:hypothetical protein